MPTKRDIEAAKEAFERAKTRLAALTDEQIEAAADADEDNPLATDEELAGAWRVKPVEKTAAE